MDENERSVLQSIIERNILVHARQDFVNDEAARESEYIRKIDEENMALMRVTNLSDLFNLEFNPKLLPLDRYPKLKMALQLQAKLKYLRVVNWRQSGGNIDFIIHEIAQSNVSSFNWINITDKGNPNRQVTQE